jgi:hypothetical protein
VQPQAPGTSERFTADALRNTANGWLARSALDIAVERWATAAELEKLTTILASEGLEAFVEALRALGPSGGVHEYARWPEVRRSWWEFDAAFDLRDDKGRRRIVIAAGTEDGVFRYVELRPEPGGGTGRMAEYADVVFNRQTGKIEFEGLYSSVRLERVCSVGPTRR